MECQRPPLTHSIHKIKGTSIRLRSRNNVGVIESKCRTAMVVSTLDYERRTTINTYVSIYPLITIFRCFVSLTTCECSKQSFPPRTSVLRQPLLLSRSRANNVADEFDFLASGIDPFEDILELGEKVPLTSVKSLIIFVEFLTLYTKSLFHFILFLWAPVGRHRETLKRTSAVCCTPFSHSSEMRNDSVE